MKNTFLACGVAAAFVLSAGAALATPLNPGLYSLNMSGGGSSDDLPVSISGTGGSRQIVLNGTETIPVTLSGTNFTGSTNSGGHNLSLTGSTTATGGTGTFHLTHNGHVGNGAFTLTPRSAIAPRMQRSSTIVGQAWDDLWAWFDSWTDVGATSGPTAPGTGSGSTPGHLAPYRPPQ